MRALSFIIDYILNKLFYLFILYAIIARSSLDN